MLHEMWVNYWQANALEWFISGALILAVSLFFLCYYIVEKTLGRRKINGR